MKEAARTAVATLLKEQGEQLSEVWRSWQCLAGHRTLNTMWSSLTAKADTAKQRLRSSMGSFLFPPRPQHAKTVFCCAVAGFSGHGSATARPGPLLHASSQAVVHAQWADGLTG